MKSNGFLCISGDYTGKSLPQYFIYQNDYHGRLSELSTNLNDPDNEVSGESIVLKTARRIASAMKNL